MMGVFRDRREPGKPYRPISPDNPVSSDEAESFLGHVEEHSGMRMRGDHILLPGGVMLPAVNQHIRLNDPWGAEDTATATIPAETGHLHYMAAFHPFLDDDEMHLRFQPDFERNGPKKDQGLRPSEVHNLTTFDDPNESRHHTSQHRWETVPRDRFHEAVEQRMNNPYPLSQTSMQENQDVLRGRSNYGLAAWHPFIMFADDENDTHQLYHPKDRTITPVRSFDE
jgi:hypothetical protein